jgi:hypothetical protein
MTVNPRTTLVVIWACLGLVGCVGVEGRGHSDEGVRGSFGFGPSETPDGGVWTSGEPSSETTPAADPTCADASAKFVGCTGQVAFTSCTPELVALVMSEDCEELRRWARERIPDVGDDGSSNYFPRAMIATGQDGLRHVLLLGSRCDGPGGLKEEAAALRNWAIRMGETPSASPTACLSHDGSLALDVTSTVPTLVGKLQGVTPLVSGPNCWNAALVSAGMVPYLRYVDGWEMRFWMNYSGLCYEPPANVAAQPGDIIAIRQRQAPTQENPNPQDPSEVHGMVYVTDQLVFSKNGAGNTNPYSLQVADDVFGQVYGVRPECRSIVGTPNAGHQCANGYANLFRCKSAGEFLNDNPEYQYAYLSPELQSVASSVLQMQRVMQRATLPFDHIPATDWLVAEVGRLTPSLYALARQRRSENLSAVDHFYWEMSFQQLYSISPQYLGLFNRCVFEDCP